MRPFTSLRVASSSRERSSSRSWCGISWTRSAQSSGARRRIQERRSGCGSARRSSAWSGALRLRKRSSASGRGSAWKLSRRSSGMRRCHASRRSSAESRSATLDSRSGGMESPLVRSDRCLAGGVRGHRSGSVPPPSTFPWRKAGVRLYLAWTGPGLLNRLVKPVKHPLPLRSRIPVLPLFLGLLWALPATAAPPKGAATPPKRATAPPKGAAPGPAPPVAIQQTDTVTIAVVDGIPIQKLQWDRLADPYFREVEARAGRALTGDEKTLLRKNVFEELVRERLWVADAKRRGFTATEAELDARLQKNDYFKTAGKLDPEKFRQFKYSPESNYRVIAEQVKNAVLLDKYVAWMRTRYAIPESELRKEFQSRTAQASIRYLWLTPDLVPLERQATAEEIRAYYDRHPEAFQSPEEARITYLRVPIEPAGRASDSLRTAVEAQTQLAARAVLAALESGRSAEAVAKEYGGLHDTGVFRVGDPVRGLGRSDALVGALKSARPKQWLPDPIKFGTFYILARLEEHREPKARPFLEVVGQVKRHADAEVRSAETDSLARIDFAARPERYRVPLLGAVVLARATDSFTDSRPVSDRDLSRALERIRKSSGMPDTAHVWADSLLKSLPDLVRKERQLDLAFRTLGDAASRLRRGEGAEEVARRFDATLDPVSLYRGQPPERALLLEGSLLDSLYTMPPGSVVGPRAHRDSVFVARVV